MGAIEVPPLGPISFIFMQFLCKILNNKLEIFKLGLVPSLEILDPLYSVHLVKVNVAST